MSDVPFLSILITTYNRSFFLAKCLESIVKVLSNCRRAGDIEVIVLNNGCTDDTAEVIRRFEKTLALKVFYEERNIGFINGLLKLIDSSKGKYCWFLGDDDYIVLEDLDTLIGRIEQTAPDILLLNHYCYIYEKGKTTFLMKGKGKYLLKGSRDCYNTYRDYIMDARHPNAFFGHIAPVIFRRNQWYIYFSTEAMERFARSYSSHTHVFLSLLRNAKKICYYPEQTLALCFGAHSEGLLTQEGRYYRFLMGAEYFPEIFESVFQERDLVKHFKDVFLKKDILVLLLGSKIKSDFPLRFYLKLCKLFYAQYKTHPFFWYAIMPLLFIPRTVFIIPYRLFMNNR